MPLLFSSFFFSFLLISELIICLAFVNIVGNVIAINVYATRILHVVELKESY